MLKWHSEEGILDEWGDEIDLEEEFEIDGDEVLEAIMMGHVGGASGRQDDSCA